MADKKPGTLSGSLIVRKGAANIEDEHGACRVLTNLGRYQDSKHLHFHVSSGDPLR